MRKQTQKIQKNMSNTIVENPENALATYNSQMDSGLLQSTGKPLGLTAWAEKNCVDLEDKTERKAALKEWRHYVKECQSGLKAVGALILSQLEENGQAIKQVKPAGGGYNICVRPLTKVESKGGSAELAAEKAKVAKLEADMAEMRAMMLALTAGRA